MQELHQLQLKDAKLAVMIAYLEKETKLAVKAAKEASNLESKSYRMVEGVLHQ